MAKVAFIGTGLLGSAMVEGLLRRGDPVTVWNRTEAKARALEPLGARVAASPADAVERVDRVHMTRTDDAGVDRILTDLTPRLSPDAIVVDHSTVSPTATATRVRRMAESGVRFLHAPVFMSPAMASQSIGLMLVAGPAALFEAVRRDLEKMTGEVWYVGEDGQRAAALKIFGNSMIFVIIA